MKQKDRLAGRPLKSTVLFTLDDLSLKTIWKRYISVNKLTHTYSVF